jgi:5-methylcytosine-specific restriction endonuclease McrA
MSYSTIHSGKRKKAVPAKPKKRKKHVGVKVLRDGREVCNLKTEAGRREYAIRRAAAWAMRFGFCAICEKPVPLEEATVDHILPRGMGGGKRDDRLGNLQPAHWKCNVQKGSRRDV